MGIMDIGCVQDVRLTDDFQLPLSYRALAVKYVQYAAGRADNYLHS